MNSTVQKNELIFDYSSGSLGEAKSLFVSMYLYLNTLAARRASIFENILAEDFNEIDEVYPKKLKYSDCIKKKPKPKNPSTKVKNPITNILGDLEKINWKTVYKGFKEFNLTLNDKDSVKLIKMDPGTSVPLHSHNGKEYILVLEGSFCDEYGEYNKGDLQINDQKIKHNPIACKNDGCVCLSITENDVVFFGKFGSALNLFTFIKSFFK
tara:strand:- start:30480 stop:31109 length:630 start_codon:yes stop_codon:yes gene_type:complete